MAEFIGVITGKDLECFSFRWIPLYACVSLRIYAYTHLQTISGNLG